MTIQPVSSKSIIQPERNISCQLREIVARILALFNEISKDERVGFDDTKREYHQLSKQSADKFLKTGRIGLGAALTNIVWTVVFSDPNHKAILDSVTGITNQAGNLWINSNQSDQKIADSKAQILFADYQDKSTKSQSNTQIRQELTSLLDKVAEQTARAARSQ